VISGYGTFIVGTGQYVGLDNRGTISPGPLGSAHLTIAAGHDDIGFNLDGFSDAGVLNVNPGAFLSDPGAGHLTIDVKRLSDDFSGRINIGSHDRLTFVHPWVFDGDAHFIATGSNVATLDGAKVTVNGGTIGIETGVGAIDAELFMTGGMIHVAPNATLRFNGKATIANTATLSMPGGIFPGSGSTLDVRGDVTINQSVIDLDGTTGDNVIVVASGKKLTLNTASIDTGDSRFNGSMNVSGTMNLNMLSASAWILGGGGVLNLVDRSNPDPQVGGSNIHMESGGLIRGQGLFLSSINNVSGVVSPDLTIGQVVSAGSIAVAGASTSYSQGQAGRLVMDLYGSQNFDRLAVNVGNLGGALELSVAGSYQPQPYLTHRLVTANQLNGHFSRVDGVVLDGTYGLAVTYAADGVYVQKALLGDANLDQQVGLADFNILAANFGGASGIWVTGDFSGDGLINLTDFNLLAGHFGMTALATAPTPEDWSALAAAVPEPGCLGLLAAGALLRRRARRSEPRSSDPALARWAV
jgi:hypothetical protein